MPAAPPGVRRAGAVGSLGVDMPAVSFVVNGSLAGVSGRFVPLCREFAASATAGRPSSTSPTRPRPGSRRPAGRPSTAPTWWWRSAGTGPSAAAPRGVASTGVPLGIVPHGTANLLARTLGIPGHPRAALDLALDPRRAADDRRIDLAIADRRALHRDGGHGPRRRRRRRDQAQAPVRLARLRDVGGGPPRAPADPVHHQAGRRAADRADGAVGRRRQLRAAARAGSACCPTPGSTTGCSTWASSRRTGPSAGPGWPPGC